MSCEDGLVILSDEDYLISKNGNLEFYSII